MSVSDTITPFAGVPRSERYINRKRQVLNAVPFIGVLSVIFGLYTLLGSEPTRTEFLIKFTVFTCLAGLAVGLMLRGVLSVALNRLSWLPKSYCGQLADLIDAHPALQPYRAQVLAMNRQFTIGEYDDLFDHVNQCILADDAKSIAQLNDVGCKRLYGLED